MRASVSLYRPAGSLHLRFKSAAFHRSFAFSGVGLRWPPRSLVNLVLLRLRLILPRRHHTNARPFVCGSFRSLRSMSGSDKVNLASPAVKQAEEAEVEGDVLDGELDDYDGVIINITKQMDSGDFVKALRTSMARWKLQGKKGVWIKLPIEHVNLVEAAVKEGFWYHHAEPKYLMLVHWIPDTPDTLPANASHRIGVAAFVTNDKKEVLVVLENSGKFKGTGVWKFPTGVVDEGEDIFDAAQREVKEETGVSQVWKPSR
uniref:Nudix hydrolase domain-containing protein n=1 Tax=Kalanchoe fedtschenkoi TaxID=63787 RepID=A0A7N0UEE6_KALFE